MGNPRGELRLPLWRVFMCFLAEVAVVEARAIELSNQLDLIILNRIKLCLD